MRLSEAKPLAQKILETMNPFIERAEIAGSIRRKKAECRDIEIVAIPRLGQPKDLFGLEPENLLYKWAMQMEREERIHWIKPGTDQIIRWPLQEQGKYWRGLLVKSGIKLDLFLTTKESWGVIYLIRTGSSDFSFRCVSKYAMESGHNFHNGHLFDSNGRIVPTPEEEDVFRALGLDYIAPEDRK